MKLSLLFLGALANADERRRFDGDKVLRIQAKNELQLNMLLKHNDSFKGAWKEINRVGDHLDLHVGAEDVDRFEMELFRNRLEFTTMIEDVQVHVDENYGAVAADHESLVDFDYNKYHTFDQHQQWMKEFAAENSDLVTQFDYGKSGQGRPLNGLKIGSGSKHIFMMGGIHSREWVTPINMVNLCKQLVEDSDKSMVEDITWHIVINANPDGFVYTHTNDRMWRKTRSDNGLRCMGVDPNRNFDANWSGPGASGNSCSETFYGPAVWSEAETAAIRDYVSAHKDVIKVFYDVHAYSQYWMHPYGYKADLPPNFTDHSSIGKAAVAEIKAVHGLSFKEGSIINVIYQASGSTVDWAVDAGIPCAYALELRDKGRYGFLLPENQIKPVCEEMYPAYKSVAKAVLDGKCN